MSDPRRLTLLLLYDGLYPESLGGVEVRDFELARALQERGHRVVLGGLTDNARASVEGVEICSLGRPDYRYNTSGRRSLREAFRLALGAARLDLGRFDVIESANIPYLQLLPLAFRCRWHKKPLVVTWYEYWGRYWRDYLGPLRWLPYAAIEWLCAQLGDRVVAPSRLTHARLGARRLRGQVRLNRLGIDFDAVRALAAEGGEPGAPLIHAGRFLVEKRVDLLIRALALLPRELGDPLLTLIGDGPESDRLRRLARELGVEERVRFHGQLPHVHDVWRQLGRARIAIQTSAREGFGLFPLEAMAAGLPVVHCRSSESAVSEIVESGVHGLAVEPASEALAAALTRLLTDEKECRRLSANAVRHAAGFAWSNVAREFEEILFELFGRDGV